MSLLNSISRFVKDPPPEYAFELSETGIAFSQGSQIGFQPLDEGALVVSPSTDNVLRPEVVADTISADCACKWK